MLVYWSDRIYNVQKYHVFDQTDNQPGLMGHDPARGLGQHVFQISRVGSGRVGSGRGVFKTLPDRVGPPVLDPARADLT